MPGSRHPKWLGVRIEQNGSELKAAFRNLAPGPTVFGAVQSQSRVGLGRGFHDSQKYKANVGSICDYQRARFDQTHVTVSFRSKTINFGLFRFFWRHEIWLIIWDIADFSIKCRQEIWYLYITWLVRKFLQKLGSGLSFTPEVVTT